MSSYPFPEKTRLIDKLLACFFMKTRRTRERILQQLPEQISSRIPDDPLDRIHITNIIDACWDYKGGLADLVDIIKYYEGDSQPMQELDALLEEILPMSIKPSHLREIKGLLVAMRCPRRVLLDAYRFSSPLGPEWFPPTGYNDKQMCSVMLNMLADAPPQQNEIVPIFLFVRYLIKYLEEQHPLNRMKTWLLHSKLIQWLHNTAKEQGFGKESMREIEPFQHPHLEPSPYLLIALRPNEYDQDLFFVTAWILDSGYKAIAYYPYDEVKSIDEVSVLLDELLAYSDAHIGEAMEKLIVEFLLPQKLICCDVDHWMVNAGKYTRVKIGLKHQVVVRSYERAYDNSLWTSWKTRWINMQNHLNLSNTSMHSFIICDSPECENQESFYAKLNMQNFACLALTLPPFDITSGRADILHTMLDVGIPIALWSREHTNISEKTREKLESLLNSCTPSQLPYIIWKQRMEAASMRDKQHLGHKLTLLWDDPERLPPDVRFEGMRLGVNVPLQAPLKKGMRR